ncbi:MAG: hypothetical protein AB8G86_29780 [Saprospiraceae bacterium]
MKKILLAILTLVVIFTACKNEEKRDYDQMAKDLCSCMRPLADVNNQIKNLVAEGKTQEVSALFTKVEAIAKEGEDCANSLELKYGVVEGESEKKTSAAIKKHCPDIAAMLEQSEAAGQ